MTLILDSTLEKVPAIITRQLQHLGVLETDMEVQLRLILELSRTIRTGHVVSGDVSFGTD